MKSILLLPLLLFIYLSGCSEAEVVPSVESTEDMTQTTTHRDTLKGLEASEKEKTMIEEFIGDETFEEILKVEMDPDFPGEEYFTKSIIEKEGNPIAIFRTIAHYKDELLVLFKTESGENEHSPYVISGIMPYTFEESNFVIVERTLHPNNQFAYFVVGKPVYENDIRVVIDNAIYQSRPIQNGSLRISENEFSISSTDRSVNTRVHFFTDTNIYEQQ